MTFWEFLSTPLARLVIAGTVLAILALIAWWYIKGLREEIQDDEPSASDLLDQFRDLRDQGRLSPEEFKKIKSRLGNELREEVAGAPRSGDANAETTDPSRDAIARALAASIEKARQSDPERSDLN